MQQLDVNKGFMAIHFFLPQRKFCYNFFLINIIDNIYRDIWHLNHADMSFAV